MSLTGLLKYSCEYFTILNDSLPRDLFDFSDESPKTGKIKKELLLVSAQIGCDAWLMNHSKLYSSGVGRNIE